MRTRCRLCCNDNINLNAVIRKCAETNDIIHDDIHDCDEEELYIENKCVCGTQLCNRECHCHSNGVLGTKHALNFQVLIYLTLFMPTFLD